MKPQLLGLIDEVIALQLEIIKEFVENEITPIAKYMFEQDYAELIRLEEEERYA